MTPTSLFGVHLRREVVERIAHLIWVAGWAERGRTGDGDMPGKGRIPVACSVRWSCKTCRGSGTIHYDARATVREVALKLRLAHRNFNKDCWTQLDVGDEIRQVKK